MLFLPKKISAYKFSLNIREERINKTFVAKYLGLLIDEKFKFDAHVKHVCKNCLKFVAYFVIIDAASVKKPF